MHFLLFWGLCLVRYYWNFNIYPRHKYFSPTYFKVCSNNDLNSQFMSFFKYSILLTCKDITCFVCLTVRENGRILHKLLSIYSAQHCSRSCHVARDEVCCVFRAVLEYNLLSISKHKRWHSLKINARYLFFLAFLHFSLISLTVSYIFSVF
jgi:hypothetical protein